MRVAPKGHVYLDLASALEDAVLREWERRWPAQKWRETAEVSTPNGFRQAKGAFTHSAREKARSAVDSILEVYANRG